MEIRSGTNKYILTAVCFGWPITYAQRSEVSPTVNDGAFWLSPVLYLPTPDAQIYTLQE